MRRAILASIVILAAGSLFAQAVDGLGVQMAGTWELYRADTIGVFSLNEYRSGVPTRSFIDATLVLEADGSMQSDSMNLRFMEWGEHAGFLYFRTPSGNSFYKVRDLSPNVLYLVSVMVTERNANVTMIEANPSANLLLVRTAP